MSPVNDVLGVEVIHSLGSLPRYLDHVEELKLRLIHVQMLDMDKLGDCLKIDLVRTL